MENGKTAILCWGQGVAGWSRASESLPGDWLQNGIENKMASCEVGKVVIKQSEDLSTNNKNN